jgi:hypothetical protein
LRECCAPPANSTHESQLGRRKADADQRPKWVETRSTRRPFRVANKDDAFGRVGIKISPEIVGVKKKEHAPAGLIADAGNLLFADCTGEEDLTGIVTLRGDDDPSRDCESYSGNAQRAFMLGTSAALFIVFKSRGWLQWWQTVLGGLLGGAAWSLLFSLTSSFEYFDSFGLPNAIIWGGIGTATALFFWWVGLYRNSSFPDVDRGIPYAMLLLVPIAAGGVSLHRATNGVTFVKGRITAVAGEAPTRRVTVRLSNGAIVQTDLRNDTRPASLLMNQCWHLDNTWSLREGHRVYHLMSPFGGGVDDC